MTKVDFGSTRRLLDGRCLGLTPKSRERCISHSPGLLQESFPKDPHGTWDSQPALEMSFHHHRHHVGHWNIYVTFVFTKYFCWFFCHFHVHLENLIRCVVLPILQISKLSIREGLISSCHSERTRGLHPWIPLSLLSSKTTLAISITLDKSKVKQNPKQS